MKKILAFLFCLFAVVAHAQVEQFPTYIGSLTSASTPLTGGEQLYVLQNGLSRRTSTSNLFGFSQSGVSCPALSLYQQFFNTSVVNSPVHQVYDGTTCVPLETLNTTGHFATYEFTPTYSVSTGVQPFTGWSAQINGSTTGFGTFGINAAQIFNLTDNVNAGAQGLYDMYIGQVSGGSNLTGNRTTLFSFYLFNQRDGTTAPSPYFYVAHGAEFQGTVNDGGTGGTASGRGVAGNDIAILTGTATFWNGLQGREVDCEADSGTSVNFKQCLKIVLLNNDAVKGSVSDYLIGLVKSSTATGSTNTGITFGEPTGYWPIATTGTMIGTQTSLGGGPSYSASLGVDLSAVAFSTGSFKGPGFLVSGNGQIQSGGIGVGSGALTLNGTSSGSGSLFANATGSLGLNVPTSQFGVMQVNGTTFAEWNATQFLLGSVGGASGTLVFNGSASGSSSVSVNSTGTLSLDSNAGAGIFFNDGANGSMFIAASASGAIADQLSIHPGLSGSNAVSLIALGSDTNVAIALATKGTGGVIIQGTGTNDSATSGNIGEIITSTVASPGSGITTNTPSNVTSVSLTPGDWDVEGQCNAIPAATTTQSQLFCSIGTTSATGNLTAGFFFEGSGIGQTGAFQSQWSANTPIARFSFASTTSVFLVQQNTFGTSTETVWGTIRARRVR